MRNSAGDLVAMLNRVISQIESLKIALSIDNLSCAMADAEEEIVGEKHRRYARAVRVYLGDMLANQQIAELEKANE